MTRFVTSIGSIGIGVDAAGVELDRHATSLLFDVDSATEVDVFLRVLRSSLVRDERRSRFDSEGVWRLVEADGTLRFEFYSTALGDAPYKVATIARDWSGGEIALHAPYLAERRGADPLEYPLDELIVMHLLPRAGGLLVHATAIVHEGRALLFLGHSGAGKSTITERWKEQHPNDRVLSDDRVVLRRVDGAWMLFGTPWHGTARHADPIPAPLHRIFVLRQAKANAVQKLTAISSAAEILSRAFLPVWDRQAVEQSADAADAVVSEIPCYDFAFTISEEAVQVALTCSDRNT